MFVRERELFIMYKSQKRNLPAMGRLNTPGQENENRETRREKHEDPSGPALYNSPPTSNGVGGRKE